MIKNFKPRLYQETIFATCAKYNTLVVLPTGLGKTFIFLMAAAERLKQYPNSKIMLIGPTRPLVEQYYDVFKEHFEIDEDKMVIFTGMIKPEKRAELWKKSQLIFSTPQGLQNDIIGNKIDLSNVSLLGVDEAHRATGEYAYVWVAEQYAKRAQSPRIIAMTASPGTKIEDITEVCHNLQIEQIEARTPEDNDVKPYVKPIEMSWVKVDLGEEFIVIQKQLKHFLDERVKKLRDLGLVHKNMTYMQKTQLLGLMAEIRGRIAMGEKNVQLWNGISILSEIMKVQHALELLETQGVVPLHIYLKGIYKEGFKTTVKAVKNIVGDSDFRAALYHVEKMFNEEKVHPKMDKLKEIVSEEYTKNKNLKMIIFNQYRDNAVDVKKHIEMISGIHGEIFVGQMKKRGTGLSQKEQKAMLDRFRNGEFNVLIATSIGEEGLDIPKVDIVVFFEPIPSAIRSIQRRGRTGRQEKGRVIVLMAANTRDEGYRWSAYHKENKMHKHLQSLKQKIQLRKPKVEKTLDAFDEKEKVKIFCDYREQGSQVIKELINLGINVKLEKLDEGDYWLSERCVVEFKNVQDFVDSLIDGRLLDQLQELCRYERPLVIIEGHEDLYSMRNVHPNAIRGMLATIAVSYGIPLLRTKNSHDTAALMQSIAKREQEEKGSTFQVHSHKRKQDVKAMQEYVVSSFPNVGMTLAQELLKEFGSIKSIVNASEEELKEVEKIGKKKAQQIKEIVEKEY